MTALSHIDYGTYHLYPDHWNKSAAWGVKWIEDHITRGKTIGKPVVLEEFGYQHQSARPDVYQSWLSAVERLGGAGSQFWILTSIQDDDSLYPDYDGFRIINGSKEAALISEHAKRMNEKNR